MRIQHVAFVSLVAALAVLPGTIRAAAPAGAPEFKEVLQVLREHLGGATEESLNRAAVEGLLLALPGRVLLAGTNDAAGGEVVTRTNVFDGIGYARVARVGAGLPDALAGAVRGLGGTNGLKGLVLDLRFAGGEDYAAAAATVDLFLSRETPLLNAGAGLVNARAKPDALRLPVVALVNRESAAAAEALAAMLRQTGAGLVLGGTTAGRAAVLRDFPLSNGQTLRVAVAPVLLGDAKPVPATGVVPDIEVPVKPDEEKSFYAESFTPVATNAPATNALRVVRRPRPSEAELVRERRGETEPDATKPARNRPERETPVLADPALARAVDLLKGLAVVRAGQR